MMTSKEWMKLLARKVRPHNEVAQLMVNGEIVSPDEIRTYFEMSESKTSRGTEMLGLVQRRLSVYIWDIRALENGVVKVHKDGKYVGGYQLVNWEMFDLQGRWVGISRSAIADMEVDSWGSPAPEEAPQEQLTVEEEDAKVLLLTDQNINTLTMENENV